MQTTETAMPQEIRDFNLFVLIRRGELPGIWFADIPDLETIVQGRSLREAVSAAREAAELVVVNDLNAGLDPLRFMEGPPSEERLTIGRIMVRQPFMMIPSLMLDDLETKIESLVVQLPIRPSREVFVESTETLAMWREHATAAV